MKRYVTHTIMDKFQIDLHDKLYDYLDELLSSAVEDNLAIRVAADIPQYDPNMAPEEYDPDAAYERRLHEAKDNYIEAIIQSLYGKIGG